MDNQKGSDEQNENGSNLVGVGWLLVTFSSVFLKSSSSHGLDSCDVSQLKHIKQSCSLSMCKWLSCSVVVCHMSQ